MPLSGISYKIFDLQAHRYCKEQPPTTIFVVSWLALISTGNQTNNY